MSNTDYIRDGFKKYLELSSEFDSSMVEFIAAKVWNHLAAQPDVVPFPTMESLKTEVKQFLKDMQNDNSCYIYRVHAWSEIYTFVADRMLSDSEIRNQIMQIIGMQVLNMTCVWTLDQTTYIGDYSTEYERFNWEFEKVRKVV